jgi:citrate lyase subunit beta/citryl-CoA lyase
MREQRLRRSLLITPGNRPDRLAKAATLPADVLVLDLEDGVPSGQKDAARAAVAQFLATADCGPRERCVRVNAIGTPDFAADLAALPFGSFDSIMVPKVERPAALGELDDALRACERAGEAPVDIIVSLETPRGVLDALPISDASPRTSALFFGSGDYCAATGAAVSAAVLQFPRAVIAAAAAAAGLQALDAAFFGAVKAPVATREDALLARELGFAGKLVFHPAQVAVANAVFSPTEDEIAWAEKVVQAYQRAHERGVGTIMVDGSFVALDLVLMGERILTMAARIASRERNRHGAV